MGVLGACDGTIDDVTVELPEPTEPVDPGNLSDPVRDPIGPADLAPGRTLRRMTASQFNASLTVATGQVWDDFERYAAALGRADFAEITEEGTEFNVTFEKLVEDAARETCRDAVEADLDGASPAVILRHAAVEDAGEAVFRENLAYLLLRFQGKTDEGAQAPWLALLQAPADDEMNDAQRMQARWTAVCVGLVTHPDFVAY
ncbi:MAG: hypothetical protein AAF645_02895 [Myxococcota bacterium]